MSYKQVDLPKVGLVKLYKRRDARNLKVTVNQNGEVRVTLPSMVPYAVGIKFVSSKVDWIQKQRNGQQIFLKHNERIGKAHHLVLYKQNDISQIKTKIKDNLVMVSYPPNYSKNDQQVQTKARTAVTRALKLEADSLLPQRLDYLSAKTGLQFNGVKTRYLKSRWGSCNHKNDLVLNVYLLQLPWELIDYVLLHELTHTRVLSHGPRFWSEFEKHLPNAKKMRTKIRHYRPYGDIDEKLSVI